MLLQDYVFLDEMAHFDRERIPERVVHAKGAGLCMREYMYYLCIVIFVFTFYSVLILVIYFTFFPFFSLSLPLSSPGAFGYFEVTHDITNLCKAKVFSKVGKRTPIAVRFSTVGETKFITLLYLCTVAVS